MVAGDDYERVKAHYEERWFQRQLSQGQLAAPMVISDTQPALQSQTDGKIYDSKSEMRKEYRRAGVVEVGNERAPYKVKTKDDRKKQREKIKGALYKAHSQMGYGAP